MILRTLFILLIPIYIQAESLAYYKGYLIYKNYLEDSTPSYDFNQVIEGMKAAYNGLELSLEEIQARKKELYAKAKEERLNEANRFMAEIVLQNDVVELVKGKLAYKTTQKGHGSEIQENDSPSLLYKAKTLANGKEIPVVEMDEPKTILLKSTITGFFQGVVGMQEGEKRILYIHPDLAYGSGSELIEPNSQMIFEVDVVKK